MVLYVCMLLFLSLMNYKNIHNSFFLEFTPLEAAVIKRVQIIIFPSIRASQKNEI